MRGKRLHNSNYIQAYRKKAGDLLGGARVGIEGNACVGEGSLKEVCGICYIIIL